MTKFTSTFAAFVCTVLVSTTLLFGAVGPATAMGQHTAAARVA